MHRHCQSVAIMVTAATAGARRNSPPFQTVVHSTLYFGLSAFMDLPPAVQLPSSAQLNAEIPTCSHSIQQTMTALMARLRRAAHYAGGAVPYWALRSFLLALWLCSSCEAAHLVP